MNCMKQRFHIIFGLTAILAIGAIAIALANGKTPTAYGIGYVVTQIFIVSCMVVYAGLGVLRLYRYLKKK